ncbi:MAG: flagellar hook-length control protein FliK [Bacillota bacterium]|nr:flagellar hook-length control protein FliK [Bacillota bacterium]
MNVFNTKNIKILDMSSNKITNVSTKTKDAFGKILNETQNNDVIESDMTDSKTNLSKFEKFISNVQSKINKQTAEINTSNVNTKNTVNDITKSILDITRASSFNDTSISEEDLNVIPENLSLVTKDINKTANVLDPSNTKDNTTEITIKSAESPKLSVENLQKQAVFEKIKDIIKDDIKKIMDTGIKNVNSDIKSENKPDNKVSVKADINAETKIDNKVLIKANINEETKPDIKVSVKSDADVETKPNIKVTAKSYTETKNDNKDLAANKIAQKIIDTIYESKDLNNNDIKPSNKTIEGLDSSSNIKDDTAEIKMKNEELPKFNVENLQKQLVFEKIKDIVKTDIKETKDADIKNVKYDIEAGTKLDNKFLVESVVNAETKPDIKAPVKSDVNTEAKTDNKKEIEPSINNTIKSNVKEKNNINNLKDADIDNKIETTADNIVKKIISTIYEFGDLNINDIKSEAYENKVQISNKKSNISGFHKLISNIQSDFKEQKISDNKDVIKNKANTTNELQKLNSKSEVDNKTLLDIIDTNHINIKEEKISPKSKNINVFQNKITNVKNKVQNLVNKIINNEPNLTDEKINEIADKILISISQSGLLTLNNKSSFIQGSGNKQNIQGKYDTLPFEKVKILKQEIAECISNAIKSNVNKVQNTDNKVNTNNKAEILTNNISNKIVSSIIKHLVLDNIIEDGKSKAVDNIKVKEAPKSVGNIKANEMPKSADNFKVGEAPKVTDNIKAKEFTKTVDNIKVNEISKAVDNIKAEEVPKAVDNIKAEETLKVTDNIKVNEIPETADNIKVEEVPKAINNIKAEEVPKAINNIKAEEVPKAINNIKAEEVPKAVDNVKAGEVPKAVDNVKAGEVPKAVDNVKAEEAPKAINNIKVEEAPKTADNIKAEEVSKAADNIKGEEVPKTANNIKVEEAPKVTDNIKIEEAPKTDNNIKVNEAPKAADSVKAGEVPKVADSVKAGEAPKTTDKIKVNESPKAAENIKVEELPKTDNNIKTEGTLKVADNIKVNETPKAADNIKAEEVPKITDKIKAEEVPKITDKIKAEEVPKITDNIKAEEVPKTTDNIKAGEVPKTVDNIKAEEVLKTVDNIKADEVPKVTENIKVEEAPKTTDDIKVNEAPKATEHYEIQSSLEISVNLKDWIPVIKNQIKELVTKNIVNQTNLTDEKINDLSKQIIKNISEVGLLNVSNVKADTVQSDFKLTHESKQSVQGAAELKPQIKLEAAEQAIIQNIKNIIRSSVKISSNNLVNKDAANKEEKISINIAKKIINIVKDVPITAEKLLSNYNDITYEPKFIDEKIDDLADEVVSRMSESKLLEFENLKLPDIYKNNSKLKEEVTKLIPFVQIEIVKQMITDSIKDVIKDNIKVTPDTGNIKGIHDSNNKEKLANNITQKIIDIVSVIPSITKNVVSNDVAFVSDKEIPNKDDSINKNKIIDGTDKVTKTVVPNDILVTNNNIGVINDPKVIESISKLEKPKAAKDHKNDIKLEKLKTNQYHESNIKSEEPKVAEYYQNDNKFEKAEVLKYHKNDDKLENPKAAEYHESNFKSESANAANDTLKNINTSSIKGEPFNDNLTARIMDALKAAISTRENIVTESKPENKDNNKKAEILVDNISEVETLNKNEIKTKNNDSNSGSIKDSKLNVSKADNLIQNVQTKVDRQGIENHIEYKMQVSTANDTTKKVSKEEKLLISLADPKKEKSESETSKSDNKMTKVFNFLSQFERIAPENKIVQAPEKYNINKAQFVDDMIKNFKYMDKNGIKEMTVKIVPKELGEVVIKLTMEGNIIKASVTAANKDTYNLLNSNLHEIVNKLTNENMKIQSFNINLYNGDAAFLNQNSDNHNFSRQQDGRNSSNRRDNDINTNIEVHNEEVHEQNNINILA